MDNQEWMIGVLTPQELAEHQEHLEAFQRRVFDRQQHLASWLFERQAIAEEEQWQREHPRT